MSNFTDPLPDIQRSNSVLLRGGDTVTFTKIQLCRGFEFLSGLERRRQ